MYVRQHKYHPLLTFTVLLESVKEVEKVPEEGHEQKGSHLSETKIANLSGPPGDKV